METIILGLWWFLRIYYYVMIAYILMSWIPELRNSRLRTMLHQITDPYLRLFRGIIVIGQMDLTPIAGLLLFQFGLGALGQVIASF